MSNFDDLLPYGFALIVAVPFVILLRQFVFQFIKLKNKELSIISGKSNAQIRLQAYERMTLFLERMKPSNLVQKFDKELAAVEFVFLVEKILWKNLSIMLHNSFISVKILGIIF